MINEGLCLPYIEWTKNKVKVLVNKLGEGYFKDKTVVDLGPMHGYLSQELASLGAKPTLYEGRQMNIDFIKRIHPSLTDIHLMNLEEDFPKDKFDIVCSFGLVYHMKDTDKHLNQCLDIAKDLVILESHVRDSVQEVSEYGPEVPSLGLGSSVKIPSEEYISDYLNTKNLKYEVIYDASMNLENKRYNKCDDPGIVKHRLWIIYK